MPHLVLHHSRSGRAPSTADLWPANGPVNPLDTPRGRQAQTTTMSPRTNQQHSQADGSEGKPKRRKKKISAKTGLPPGSLVYVGRAEPGRSIVTVTDYDADRLVEHEVRAPKELQPVLGSPSTAWVNVDGLGQVDVIAALGESFHIHHLLMEDVLNTTQRPKIEVHDEYFFLVLKMLRFDDETEDLVSDQTSLVVGPGFVLSFNERESGAFDQLRERIRSGSARIRKAGSDYLAYCLIDVIVDQYFVLLEKFSERLEIAEEQLVTNPAPQLLKGIHRLKMDLIALRRSVWPLREVINNLVRGDTALIQPATLPYLRDVYDHTIHAAELIESFRDVVSGMLDIYLSSNSNKLNEIMKVLTIIATIFIPLTFISGWYGMNFENMPELKWAWGYPMVIGLALGTVTTMLLFFRRRKWL
jgi:magnesium transporter